MPAVPATWTQPTGGGVKAPVADSRPAEVTPAKTLSNSAYGIRANTLVGGWDLAAFYYRSYDVSPTFYRLPGPSAAQPFVFQPQHDRIWQVGGTASKDFGPFVGRAELVYTDGRNFASTDPTVPQGVLARDTYDWVVSADFTLPHDVRLNVQAFQRIYSSSDSSLALQTGDWGGSVLLAGKITPTVEPLPSAGT